VDLVDLRRMGAFFTGERLAANVVSRAGRPTTWSKVVDPACGCGDLLLAAARKMPIHGDVESTLQRWGEVLHGIDCIPDFVDVARQRLMLLALLRGARITPGDLPCLNVVLPNIVTDDGRRHEYLSGADVVLMNPPYGNIPTPKPVTWTSGLVTESALWVTEIIERLPQGARLVAVLPDVLRSGSRYAKWRAEIAKASRVLQLRSAGQFDALTDVDVFVLVAKRSVRGSKASWPTWPTAALSLGELCSVMVGPVVDGRDPHDGSSAPYITTRELPQSGEFTAVRERRFSRRLFKPPFVVVRRTSRPTVGQQRLRPVIIRGPRDVAVENHLLVLRPNKPTLATCRALAACLVDQRTTDWLNQRIRTRHLTVSALREVPLATTGAEVSKLSATT
jgi:hypothetical protein